MIRVSFAIIFFLLFISSITFAGTRGKIVGSVIDKSTKEPISDVNLYLEGTRLGAATDSDGYFIILNLLPGNYTLVVQHLGYQTQKIDDIKVAADLTTRVNFELQEVTLESDESVVVTAEKPLIRPDNTAKLSIVDGSEIVTMPVQNLNEVVASRSGITTDADGNLHFRGGRTAEVLYLVDGQPVDNPVMSNPLDVSSSALVNNYAIQELQILSGTFNAEYGTAMSGIVNIVTNEGSNQIKAKIEVTSSNLNSSPYRKQNALVQDANPIYDQENNLRLEYKDVNALDIFDPSIPAEGNLTGFLSGPLPARFGNFFLSGDYRNENSWRPHGYNFRRTLFGKLTFPIGINKLNLSIQYSDQNLQNYDHRYKYLPENQGHWDNKSTRYALKYNHVFTRNSYAALNVSYLDGKSLYRVKDLNYTEYIFPELDENLEFVVGGNSQNHTDLKSKTLNLRADGFLQLNRHHEFKVGMESNLFHIDAFDYSKEGDNEDEFFLNTYNKKPLTASAYLQDKIEYGSFIINAGLRGDYVDSKGVSLRDIEDPFSGLESSKPEFKISPRLGIAYPISENTVFHFSYGHFLQFPNFQLIYQNLQFLNPDELAQARIALIGNPNVQSQKTVAYEFGVSQKIGQNIAIDLTAYSKDISDLLGTIYVENLYRYSIFTNNDFARVQGIDISIRKRLSSYWSAQFEYTFGVARGNESSPTEEAYNIFEGRERSIKEFYLDFDRTHDFALNLSFVLPRGFGPGLAGLHPFQNINLFVLGQFSSGLPYTPVSDDRTKLFEKNSARMPWTNTVDLRLEKFFPASRFTFSVFLQIINLFDRLNPFIVQPRTGRIWDDGKSTLFGTGEDFLHNPGDVGQPRLIKLGFSAAM